MAKQVLVAFFVFLLFVMGGVIIFLVTTDVGRYLPLPGPQTLAEQMAVWEVTTDEKGRFAFKTPTFTQESVDNFKLPNDGGSIAYEIYTANGFSGERYVMGVVELPADFDTSDSSSILDAQMLILLEGYGYSALVDQKTIDYLGHPGMEFRMNRGGRALACRFVLIDKTLYKFCMDIQGDDLPEENFKYFVDSFTLNPKEVPDE